MYLSAIMKKKFKPKIWSVEGELSLRAKHGVLFSFKPVFSKVGDIQGGSGIL